VSGHVADSLTNMDTIRAFAAEDREAAEHRSRVADQRRKSLRSWDYGNLRIDALVAPMSVLTNVFGLLLAIALGAGRHGIEAIVVAFTYYSNATRIMFELRLAGRIRHDGRRARREAIRRPAAASRAGPGHPA
jgi:ATP-binding cassette, subfamily B, bacterial